MLFPKAYYRFNVIGKCCHRSGTQELAAEPTLFTFAYFEKSVFMELTDMEKWLLYQIKGYEQYAVCKFFVIASGTVLGILSGIFFLIALNFLLKSFPFSIFPQ